MKKKLVVFGLGQRGNIYATYAKTFPDKFELSAIIENSPERITFARENFPNTPLYVDYREFLNSNTEADIVAVCTQDEDHKEHSVAMMQAGYDLLLEKPVANNENDCRTIYEASKKYGRKVIVCHVLRYTPFYSTVKRIIDSGEVGEVVSIDAAENVGYYHQAHSFVRGPWRNKELSSPMILAKCCHDMDIIRYLIGEKCLSVGSYGELSVFNKAHAPEGSADYCSECKYADCIYKAQTIYTSEDGKGFSAYFSPNDRTDEGILKNLKRSLYDRCVYKCDNDVVDHEVTIMRFANGKTACHSMTAFSRKCYRDLKVHCTKAEIVGSPEDNKIEVRFFGGEVRTISLDVSKAVVGGHMGGDFFMMESLYKDLNGEKAEGITYLDVSVESHFMAFAAEKSRLSGGESVNLDGDKV